MTDDSGTRSNDEEAPDTETGLAPDAVPLLSSRPSSSSTSDASSSRRTFKSQPDAVRVIYECADEPPLSQRHNRPNTGAACAPQKKHQKPTATSKRNPSKDKPPAAQPRTATTELTPQKPLRTTAPTIPTDIDEVIMQRKTGKNYMKVKQSTAATAAKSQQPSRLPKSDRNRLSAVAEEKRDDALRVEDAADGGADGATGRSSERKPLLNRVH